MKRRKFFLFFISAYICVCLLAGCNSGASKSDVDSTVRNGFFSYHAAKDFPESVALLSNSAYMFFLQYGRGISSPRGEYDFNFFPTEGLSPLWSAYAMTGRVEYGALARAHVEDAISRYKDAIFIWPTTDSTVRMVGSNSQARYALGLLLAYIETSNAQYMHEAVRAAEVVLFSEHLLVKSSFSGRNYNLPCYVYTAEGPILQPASGRTMDPNQDATLALLAHLLLTIPESKYYQAMEIKNKRDEYLAAAVDLLSLERCVPVADQDSVRDGCDTLYGWFAIYQIALINEVIKSDAIKRMIENQYKYHSAYTLNKVSTRVFPTRTLSNLERLDEVLFALSVADYLDKREDVSSLYQILGELLNMRALNVEENEFSFAGMITWYIDKLHNGVER